MSAAHARREDPGLDVALRTIAHPVRRQILRLVSAGELSSSELAERCELSRPAASQHLKALRNAGLVTVHSSGGSRLYRTCVQRLAEVVAELDQFWRVRPDRPQGVVSGDATENGDDDDRGDGVAHEFHLR